MSEDHMFTQVCFTAI